MPVGCKLGYNDTTLRLQELVDYVVRSKIENLSFEEIKSRKAINVENDGKSYAETDTDTREDPSCLFPPCKYHQRFGAKACPIDVMILNDTIFVISHFHLNIRKTSELGP